MQIHSTVFIVPAVIIKLTMRREGGIGGGGHWRGEIELKMMGLKGFILT
jgi:hypothetical protein